MSVGNGRAVEAKGVGQVLIEVKTAGGNRCSQRDATFSHWFKLDAFFIDRLAHSAHRCVGDPVPLDRRTCASVPYRQSSRGSRGPLSSRPAYTWCRPPPQGECVALGGDRFPHRPCAHNQRGILNQAWLVVVQTYLLSHHLGCDVIIGVPFVLVLGPLAAQATPREAGIFLGSQKSRVPTLKLSTTQTLQRRALVGKDERVRGALGGNRGGGRVLWYSGSESRHPSRKSAKLRLTAIPVYFCTRKDLVLAVYVPLQRLHLGSTATVWIGPGIKMTVSKCSIQIT